MCKLFICTEIQRVRGYLVQVLRASVRVLCVWAGVRVAIQEFFGTLCTHVLVPVLCLYCVYVCGFQDLKGKTPVLPRPPPRAQGPVARHAGAGLQSFSRTPPQGH